MQYLAILTLPLKANEKSICRCRNVRWLSYDFFFIIIFFYLVYLFTFVFICLTNRQQVDRPRL